MVCFSRQRRNYLVINMPMAVFTFDDESFVWQENISFSFQRDKENSLLDFNNVIGLEFEGKMFSYLRGNPTT